MGNRHGGEKSKEEKKTKKKEKKSKVKKKHGKEAGLELDLDSSQYSRADSESMVFHSAENLSPYLDASTRSSDGAASYGFHDNGQILSSRDFQDGFSLEACLPADLAACSRFSDVTVTSKTCFADDGASLTSAGYSTPLLSSPQVRRGQSKSPLAERHKDWFQEPIPPIPSDISSSSITYQDDVSSSGGRSSSRTSSSTVDTNAAHCIERLEELERNIQRTIIEKFSDFDPPAGAVDARDRYQSRTEGRSTKREREGSLTPKQRSPTISAAYSAENSPNTQHRLQDFTRQFQKEGSLTPKGLSSEGAQSQSSTNSPVTIHRAAKCPLNSPKLTVRRMDNHQSPNTQKRNVPESHSVTQDFRTSPKTSKVISPKQETISISKDVLSASVSPVVLRKSPLHSPEILRKGQMTPETLKTAGSSRSPKHDSPTRILQNTPSKDQAEDSVKERYPTHAESPPLKSSDSPVLDVRNSPIFDVRSSPIFDVRRRPSPKTPSSSPSPQHLRRKVVPIQDARPPTSPSSPTLVRLFESSKIGSTCKPVSSPLSAATLLSSDSCASDENSADKFHKRTPVSEQDIEHDSETAVFGSVSPKLKRQKKVSGVESTRSGLQPKGSLDSPKMGSLECASRSPSCSPLLKHIQRFLSPIPAGSSPSSSSSNVISKQSVNVIEYKGPAPTSVCISILKHPAPSQAQVYLTNGSQLLQRSNSNEGQSPICSDIAGRITYHSELTLGPINTGRTDILSDEISREVLEPRALSTEEYSFGPNDSTSSSPMQSRIRGRDFESEYDPSKRAPTQADKLLMEGRVHHGVSRERAGQGYHYGEHTVHIQEQTSPHTDTLTIFTGCTVNKNATFGHNNEERKTTPDAELSYESLHACSEERTLARTSVQSSSPADSNKNRSKNLGERIREVIQESTFREVFTAELSPTLDEKDAGRTDSFSDIGDVSDSSRQYSVQDISSINYISSTDQCDDKQQTSESVVYRNTSKLVNTAANVLSGAKSFSSSQPQQLKPNALASINVQKNVDNPPETITICRLEQGANVIIPVSHRQEEKSSDLPSESSPHIVPSSITGRSKRKTAHQSEDSHKLTMEDSNSISTERCSFDPRVTSYTGNEQSTQKHIPHPQEISSKISAPDLKESSSKNTLSKEQSVANSESDKVIILLPKEGTTKSAPSLPTPSRNLEISPSQVNQHIKNSEKIKTESEQQNLSGNEFTKAQNVYTDITNPQSGECFTKSDDAGSENNPLAVSAKMKLEECSKISTATRAEKKRERHKISYKQEKSTTEAETTGFTGKDSESSAIKNVTTDEVAHKNVTAIVQKDALPTEHVPPPSPSAMDVFNEEEEDEDILNDHQDLDISSRISKEMQLFGDTVVKRLSNLLESQASDSDGCFDDDSLGHETRDSEVFESSELYFQDEACCEVESSEALTKRNEDVQKMKEALKSQKIQLAQEENTELKSFAESSCSKSQQAYPDTDNQSKAIHNINSPEPNQSLYVNVDDRNHIHSCTTMSQGNTESDAVTVTPIQRPAWESLFAADTPDTLSPDHDTSSSKRTSAASTTTDDTLTSFKTRSTTDSAEFEDGTFTLPESLVFVRSIDEDDGNNGVKETGHVVKRPSISVELKRSDKLLDARVAEKPRKRRRRQIVSFSEQGAKTDVTEPEPKRGSHRVRDVMETYDSTDDSDLTSNSEGVAYLDYSPQRSFRKSDKKPVIATLYAERQIRREKQKCDSLHFTPDSSEEGENNSRHRLSTSSADCSMRIPEIEETFGELMTVKTFLEDIQDKTPTGEINPIYLAAEDFRTKEFLSLGNHRRSRTSPTRTDRTESDLDISEQRDDASTDSMYADDEDEGTELVPKSSSFSEDAGSETVQSRTIYNSHHEAAKPETDEFWAESSVTAEENYKKLETSADAAGSAFQNARLQMHDIHQHLQNLRRQMELLEDDITSTSITMSPEYSLESCEQRPITE